jgi:hypothetical protein
MLHYFLKKKNREMEKKGSRGRCYGSRGRTWAAAWHGVMLDVSDGSAN